MEETNRPRYAFKIGQLYRQVGTKRIGSFTVIGLVQQDGSFSYRLSGQQLAPESELKLALQPRDER
jgi:hypothetical protein